MFSCSFIVDAPPTKRTSLMTNKKISRAETKVVVISGSFYMRTKKASDRLIFILEIYLILFTVF